MIVELNQVNLDHFQNLVVSVVSLLDTTEMDVNVDDDQMHLMHLNVTNLCAHYYQLNGVNVDVMYYEMLHVTIVHVNDVDDVDDVNDVCDVCDVDDDVMHVSDHDYVLMNVHLIAVIK